MKWLVKTLITHFSDSILCIMTNTDSCCVKFIRRNPQSSVPPPCKHIPHKIHRYIYYRQPYKLSNHPPVNTVNVKAKYGTYFVWQH